MKTEAAMLLTPRKNDMSPVKFFPTRKPKRDVTRRLPERAKWARASFEKEVSNPSNRASVEVLTCTDGPPSCQTPSLSGIVEFHLVDRPFIRLIEIRRKLQVATVQVKSANAFSLQWRFDPFFGSLLSSSTAFLCAKLSM